ncbi:MAG: PKD domain-containing protein [Chitinophagaceae bacterium]|nr:PKD domain-containing protein [Chitinophagaceae bacterium]
MKRNKISMKHIMAILFTGIFMLAFTAVLNAQNCNQPEIKAQEPDCYKSKGTDGPANPGGQGRSCTSASACVNQATAYTAGGGPWASYLWTITSGPATPPINPNATSANINITWPVVGTYILTLTVTDGAGNTYTRCIEISVKQKPVAAFTFAPNNACAGSVVNFTNGTVFSGTPAYNWNFGDPSSGPNNISQIEHPTHIFNSPGTYVVTLIAYSTMLVPNSNTNGQPGDSLTLVSCCADTISHTVTVAPGTLKIECISTVCAGSTKTYTAVGCASPIWGTPVGGTIQSTSGNTVTILWGNGNPQGQISVSCGGCTSYVIIFIVPTTPIITGSLSPCNPGSNSYSVPYLPGTEYTGP